LCRDASCDDRVCCVSFVDDQVVGSCKAERCLWDDGRDSGREKGVGGEGRATRLLVHGEYFFLSLDILFYCTFLALLLHEAVDVRQDFVPVGTFILTVC
jgi:hypothetical protein